MYESRSAFIGVQGQTFRWDKFKKFHNWAPSDEIFNK